MEDSGKRIEQYDKGFPIASIQYNNSVMRYGVPNLAALWRVSTFETKEPETVKWIAGFDTGEVFLDVGANIGLYTIFAAVYSKSKVYAFEPEAQNYSLLNRNIILNNISDKVVAWCCALTDSIIIDKLYMRKLGAAGSGHEFGQEVDTILKPKKAQFAQGSIGLSLDYIISNDAMPYPNHIKIDVDGIEHLVVNGAIKTLSDQRVRSVLIEISPYISEHKDLIVSMNRLGFEFDEGQVERARRKTGSTKNYAEYIFYR